MKVKTRKFPECNYNATWIDGKTFRMGDGFAKELPADKSEFYDIALGTMCNLNCPFCYAEASNNGKFYDDICQKAELFFGNMSENDKPFQVAIGSLGEPTIHPDFINFLKTIAKFDIVPNYTTNGITLTTENDFRDELLSVTDKLCGGVAISTNEWNTKIQETWRKAVENLSYFTKTKINLHYVVSDENSVVRFKEIYDEYKDRIFYFVLLPMMDSGRCTQRYSESAFKKLETMWNDFDVSKISFGAHFYPLLKESKIINCSLYEPESFSKNLILDNPITITRSSFDLTVLKTIEYEKK